jgi:hypothetical protein
MRNATLPTITAAPSRNLWPAFIATPEADRTTPSIYPV